MADRYWVPGSGSNIWNSTASTKWATSSGGTGGASVPTSSDNVFFDANSGTDTVTIGATVNCLNLDFTGYAGGIAGTNTLNIFGNVTYSAGMTLTHTGNVEFESTSTGKTITTNGKILTHGWIFNGAGGGWTLQDNVTNSASSRITLNAGTLDLNGKTVNTWSFNMDGTGTKTLTMGSGIISIRSNSTGITDGFAMNATNTTLNENTGTIRFTGTGGAFNGSTETYYAIESSSITTNLILRGAFTCTNLTVTGVAGDGTAKVTVSSNITVSGALTLSGNSTTERLILSGRYAGTPMTLTAASVSLANVDIQEITGAGAATWSGTSLGNAGGNSNITFTAPVTRYWVGNGGDWSDSSHWSATSGGSGGQSVPLCHDTVIFDSNSFTVAGQEVEMLAAGMFLGKDVTFYGRTHAPTYWFTDCSVFGNLTFDPGATYQVSSSSIVFEGDTDAYIYTNGAVITATSGFQSFVIDKGGNASGPRATVYLGDDFQGTFRTGFSLSSGVFNTNNKNIITGALSAYPNTNEYGQMQLTSSIITLLDNDDTSYGTRTIDLEDFSGIVNPLDSGTSTIIFRPTSLNTTFGIYLYTDFTVTFLFHKLYLEAPTASSTKRFVIDHDVSGAAFSASELTMNGSRVAQRLYFDEPETNGYVIGKLSIFGNPSSPSTLKSTSDGTATNVTITNAEIYYTDIRDVASTNPITVYNCTNVSGNSNITFATAEEIPTIKTPAAFFEQHAFDTASSSAAKNSTSWTNQTES